MDKRMSLKINFFRRIDEKIFDAIDRFKSSSTYEKYEGLLGRFSDDGQRHINMLVSYAVVLAPLLLAGIFFLGNKGKRAELEEKRRVLEEIELFNKKNLTIGGFQNTLAVSFTANNQDSLQSRINNVAGRALINTEDVTLSSYTEKEVSNNLKESSGKLNFKNLSTKQLGSLISTLIADRFRVVEIEAKKDNDGLSIGGTLEIVYFGKK